MLAVSSANVAEPAVVVGDGAVVVVVVAVEVTAVVSWLPISSCWLFWLEVDSRIGFEPSEGTIKLSFDISSYSVTNFEKRLQR